MQDLRNWLNSFRNFNEGTKIYLIYGDDSQFVQLLLAGETPYNRTLLFDKLRDVYYKRKNDETEKIDPPSEIPQINENHQMGARTSDPILSINSDLTRACKSLADKLYKEQMNIRAQLFALCEVKEIDNENDIALVIQREMLVLQLMEIQSNTDSAYATLRYVVEHGILPDIQKHSEEALPDNPVLLERLRTNTPKSMNKDKSKEQKHFYYRCFESICHR